MLDAVCITTYIDVPGGEEGVLVWVSLISISSLFAFSSELPYYSSLLLWMVNQQRRRRRENSFSSFGIHVTVERYNGWWLTSSLSGILCSAIFPLPAMKFSSSRPIYYGLTVYIASYEMTHSCHIAGYLHRNILPTCYSDSWSYIIRGYAKCQLCPKH